MEKSKKVFIRVVGTLCYLIGMVSVCLCVMMPLFFDIKIDQTLYMIGALAIVGLAHVLFERIFLNLSWMEGD